MKTGEKTRIRYILGAGASANAIPVVTKFADEMMEASAMISQDYPNQRELSSLIETHQASRILQSFSREIKDTFSIDTLARRYHLQGKVDEYNQLKWCIEITILFSELKNNVDSRYDAFLSTLIDENTKSLKPEIQLLTWNYDYQMLMAYERIFGINDPKVEGINLNLIRLNGSALNPKLIESFRKAKKELGNPETPGLILKSAVKVLIRDHHGPNKKFWDREHKHDILYSWDCGFKPEVLRSFNPHYVVIIGYSLPTYNRDIDKVVFSQDHSGKVKKYFLQCNFWDSKNNVMIDGNSACRTKLRGLGVMDEMIIDVQDSSEFYIPFEYDTEYDDGFYFA